MSGATALRSAPEVVGLLAAERIKLTSIRSPWWCAATAALVVVGLTVLALVLTPGDVTATLVGSDFLPFGGVLVLIMGAQAATTEYRFGTIRATFEAAPNRTVAVLAKAAVVAVAGGVVGLVAVTGSWAAIWLADPSGGFPLTDPDHWRQSLGGVLVVALVAVLALAVGFLVRHAAAALPILLVWLLLVESFVGQIPRVGPAIERWLPFHHAANVTASTADQILLDAPFGTWGSLAYFAGTTAGLLAFAIAMVNRRDA